MLVAGLPDFNCQARTLPVVVVVTGRVTFISLGSRFWTCGATLLKAAAVVSLHSARGCTGSVGKEGADGRRRRHCPI